jgi:hypothetical protein
MLSEKNVKNLEAVYGYQYDCDQEAAKNLRNHVKSIVFFSHCSIIFHPSVRTGTGYSVAFYIMNCFGEYGNNFILLEQVGKFHAILPL